ncbi:hypothetical protein A7982_13774 [Minicystis rosea]|nr:hypothetical protein A7982_13774 [Minicystis rosea]
MIAARSLGLWYGKPPLKEHRFDVVLQNPAKDARWMVLPTCFPYEHDTKPAPGDSPVAELQIFRLSEHPKVVLAEGVGGTFWAVKLPAGGRVTLRGLRIDSWWEKVPAEVTLEVLVARSITVGGAPLADLIGEDPLCETGADVLAAKDAGDARALHFWQPDAGYDAPLAMNVESRARVLVPLSHEMY